MDRDQVIVEFSVAKISLANDGRERQKATYYVQNRCSASRKVRVAVARGSDPVSPPLSCRARAWAAVMLCVIHVHMADVHP